MLKTVLILSLAILCIAESDTSLVVTLTDQNYDELTSKGKWLIEFYAPWCGHCKRLNPILDEASILIDQGKHDIKIGKVDCTVETNLANKFDIRGYPTLKYIRSGVTTPYEGGRTLESIMEFVKKATGPAVRDVSADNLEKFQKENEVSFILVGGSEIASEVFVSVAKKLQDSVTFGKAPSSLKSKFGENSDTFIVRLSDDDPQVYSGAFKEDDLTNWVLQNRHPLFPELGGHNFHSIANSGKKTVVAAVDPSDARTSKYLDMMREVAKQMKQHFSFGYLNGIEFQQFVQKHGVNEMPSFFVVDAPSQTFVDASKVASPHTVQSITAFLFDVQAGKIALESISALGQFIRLIQQNLLLVFGSVLGIILSIVACCYIGVFDEPTPTPTQTPTSNGSTRTVDETKPKTQ